MHKKSPLRDGRSANPLLISGRWVVPPRHLKRGLTCLGATFAILCAVERSLATIAETEFVPWSGLQAFAAEALHSLSASVSAMTSPKPDLGRVTAVAIAPQPNKAETIVAARPQLPVAETSQATRFIGVAPNSSANSAFAAKGATLNYALFDLLRVPQVDLTVDGANSPYLIDGTAANPGGTYGTVRVGTMLGGELDQTGGSFSVNQMLVGDGSASGKVDQSGGTTTVSSLFLGNTATSSGTYLLSSSATLTIGQTNIGYGGTGTFTQTGGSHTVSDGLFLGRLSTGNGTYNLSGTGTLSSKATFVGNIGTGVFNQSGGSHTLTGTGFSDGLYVGYINGSSGTYNLSGTSSVLTSTNSYVGFSGTGMFTQTNGMHTVSAKFSLGDQMTGSGTYALSAGTLSTQSDTIVGGQGTGIFNQSGGSFNTNSGALFLGYIGGATGMFTLSGGTLSASATTVGRSGTGTFNQTAGTHTLAGNLVVGSLSGSSGTYNLSGTGMLSTNATTVGRNGASTFNQSGGTHTISIVLYLGNNVNAISPGSNGTYNLSGGVLNTPVAVIGLNGNGTFNQSGGTFTVSNNLQLYGFSDGNGTYNLNGGTLALARMSGSSAGTFNLNGGTIQALADDASFLTPSTIVNVQAGGAKIDTSGFTLTQFGGLLHDTTPGAPATDGGLTKLGAGTLVLTSRGSGNTYRGGTTVSAGTLLVSSSAGPGPVSVSSGATLGGNGDIAGAVTVNNGGTLAPGNSPGTLHLGSSLTMSSGSNLNIEIGGGAAGTGYDQVQVTGALTLTGSNLNVSLVNGYTPMVNQLFYIADLLNQANLPAGTFGNAVGGTLVSDTQGNSYFIDYAASDPNEPSGTLFNDISLRFLGVTPVPEPSTWLAGALAGAVLSYSILRRRAKSTLSEG